MNGWQPPLLNREGSTDMADNIRVGIPLNNVDTAWLHMEDPTNLMMITGMYIFRQPLDFERVRDTIKYRMVGAFPRFKHKISQQGLRVLG